MAITLQALAEAHIPTVLEACADWPELAQYGPPYWRPRSSAELRRKIADTAGPQPATAYSFVLADSDGRLASIFHWLVEWGLVASLPVSWLGLCRLGVTACRVSSRGGRAFPGARGFFLQGRGGQEAGAVCLRSR